MRGQRMTGATRFPTDVATFYDSTCLVIAFRSISRHIHRTISQGATVDGAPVSRISPTKAPAGRPMVARRQTTGGYTNAYGPAPRPANAFQETAVHADSCADSGARHRRNFRGVQPH